MALILELMRGGGDNLTYLAGCSSERKVAVIDPVSAHAILEFCEQKKLRIIYVLNTHGHPDHTSGNDVIKSATGAKILAHPAERILDASEPLQDNDVVEVGRTSIKVMHTPGHTAGSLCFRINNKLITGDTLFLAGAGNTRFGGSVEDLFASIQEKIVPLSDKVEIYPGHEYAENNLRFARTLEPENIYIDSKLKELKEASRNGSFVKSALGEERKYNPFLRCKRPELLESLKTEYPDLDIDNPFEVFRRIRELRNHW